MGKVIASMTMSLDGFIQDANGSVEQLYTDFAEMHDVPSFQEMIRATGAVVMGRRTFEMGDPDGYAGAYEFQVPIFVLSHTAPARYPKENDTLSFTFVTDGIESAVAQAKAAARDRDVQVVGGASTIQQCFNAGLCDELDLDIVPILLGSGMRLLENIDTEKVKLKRVAVEEKSPYRLGMVLRVS